IAATKLPNYVLPLYPAIAILTGRWLDCWRTGELPVRPWIIAAAAAGCVLVGVLTVAALVLLAGTVALPFTVKGLGSMPALALHAWVGASPVVVGLWFAWEARRGRRTEALVVFGVGAVAFLALMSARVAAAMDDYKVPRHFAEEAGLRQTDREIR